MKFVSLSSVATHKMGGTPSTAKREYWEDGDIPWATPTDLSRHGVARVRATSRTISKAGLAALRTRCFPAGTVLLSTTATIGNLGIAEVPMCCNQQITAILPSQDLAPEFLAYYLLARKMHIAALGGTSTATHINQKSLSQFPVLVCAIETQRRIIDLLSRAEGIVRLRREAQKKAAEIIPALFLDTFGDPATNPKGFVNSRLADIAEVVSGITKGRKLNGRTARPVPYLRVANVQAGFLNLDEMKEIEATDAEIEGLQLRPGDILLTEGGDFDKLGRGAQWRGEIPTCIHQNHVFRVRLRPEVAVPDYFEAYLQTSAATRYFLSVAKRTTNLASINMTQLRSLPVILPPIALQRQFAERVATARSILIIQGGAIEKAEATFAALLNRNFSDSKSPFVESRSACR